MKVLRNWIRLGRYLHFDIARKSQCEVLGITLSKNQIRILAERRAKGIKYWIIKYSFELMRLSDQVKGKV